MKMSKSKKDIAKGAKKFMQEKDKLIKKGEPVKKAVSKANIIVRKKG